MTYRHHLPQLDDRIFLTDGGLETELIFHDGIDLPAFAAFDLLKDQEGTERLRRYYESYAKLAAERGLGLVLESPTWRASPRWAREIGYTDRELEQANRKAIALMGEVRDAHQNGAPIVVSGCIGPQDDAYSPGATLSAADAQAYHATQIAVFADTPADMVNAMTLTYAEEAIGVARAAEEAGVPAAIAFTLETDGRLPSGQPLADAIRQVDEETGSAPAYFMINCAHPAHFADALPADDPAIGRIRGLRANASQLSHAELDEATELDAGDPADLAARYVALADRLPALAVLGGCCGTDHRHVRAIRDRWLERVVV